MSSCRTKILLELSLEVARVTGLVSLLLLPANASVKAGSRVDCIGEGVKFSAREETLRCCEGLTRIEAHGESRDPALRLGKLPKGCEPVAPPDIKICTRCGDGVCGTGENRCNCATDCRVSTTD